jgi:hypothetical protein
MYRHHPEVPQRRAIMQTKAVIGAMLRVLLSCSVLLGQGPGTLRGKVTLDITGQSIHGVTATILRLNRSAVTGDDGTYEKFAPEIGRGVRVDYSLRFF